MVAQVMVSGVWDWWVPGGVTMSLLQSDITAQLRNSSEKATRRLGADSFRLARSPALQLN